MAKKVILKDLDNVEILPITRGELIVDSSGKEAFHSNEFLATNSLPGLMSPEEKTKLSTMSGNIIDSTLSTTSTNPVQNKVVTVAINETKQLANDALETANDASENVSKVQQIINSIKANYLKSATVNGNVLTIVDLSDSEITFTNTTYNTFLKETAANTGGRNGLVPKPNYNDGSKTRFLREDGTWVIPTNTSYTFADGTDGSFTVTPSGGSGQKVTIGKPATAGTADKVSKALTIKINAGTTEGTDLYTYDGSKAKTLDIKAGANITLTPTAGVLTISATNSNTTYTLSGALDGNTFVTTLTPSSGTATTAVIPAMVGATSSAAGKAGLVPAPVANKHTSFLRGDGTWIIPIDTKNTAGSTNSTSKLFLIGATSQTANPQTYSNSSVYTTNGTLYATTFVGNLDGTYVNKLTGYKIAEAINSISATDSLNTALGKLEFKTDFIYNDLFGTDNDNVINKWHEIVDFVDSVAEGTDITDEFVTRKTTLTITGLKTFLSNSSTTGVSLILKNSGWESNMSTAMDFYNGRTYTVPNARIETKMVGNGTVGGTLIFYTQTKHSSTNPNPNGLTERLRIDDNGTTKITGILTVTANTTATKFITSGGTSSLFVKGDGSLDSNTYATTTLLGLYLPLAGGTMNLGEGLKFHADNNYFGTNADARIISLLDGNGTICDGGLIIDERATSGGVEYVTELLRIRHDLFTWKGNTILHAGNYSSTLDGRYYTETEADNRFVNITGDTMTGSLTINGGNFKIQGNGNTSTKPDIYLGYYTSWQEGTYPTLMSGYSSKWIMHYNPHICKSDSTDMPGSNIRMQSINSNFYDLSVAYDGNNYFRLRYNNNKNLVTITDSGQINIINGIIMSGSIGVGTGSYLIGNETSGVYLAANESGKRLYLESTYQNCPYFRNRFGNFPILHSNNFTEYTVKKDGTGASGTWGISITGNAATATNVDWGGVTNKPSSFTPSSHNHSFILGATTITTGGTCIAITGPFAVYTYATASKAFSIYRDSESECVNHWVDDGIYHIEYTNDEASSSIAIRLINTDTERATNKGANAKDVTVYLDCYRNFYPNVNNSGSIGLSGYKWANMYATTFHGSLDGNASTATSATSAIQATNLMPENTAHYFRDPNSSAWRGGMIWGSAGSESMSFVVANSGTRFQFVGGSDIANWGSSTWQSANPYLTIYSSGIVTPGSATASGGFIKSGYNDNYVLLAGGGHKTVSDFAISNHNHYRIKLSDDRAKYPGQLTGNETMSTFGGFMQNSTLGISNFGDYSDVLVIRSYMDSTGGNDNAIIFNKNTRGVWHTQFRFGSTTSWGTPYLFLDSNNFNKYTPTLTGTGASGTWGINITGNANSATIADQAYNLYYYSANTDEGCKNSKGPGLSFWYTKSLGTSRPTGGDSFMFVMGSTDLKWNSLLCFDMDSTDAIYYRSSDGTPNWRTWAKILTSVSTYVASDGTNRGIINGSEVASARHLLINGVTWNSNWHWSGQSGQPSWLWGSNNGSDMYVWNPSNFSVNYASLVGINYNNDSNSTYQMLWGSGNYVYGTGGIYCNPYTDYLYSGSFYCGNWFRSSGATGWYNESYGGGIYMEDSTWVRIYNNKKFYVANSESSAIHSAGGVYVAGAVHSYANFLKSTCNGKTITIGSANDSFCHYLTDAPSHWFNKTVYVQGNIYGGSSYNRRLAYVDELPTNTWRGIVDNLTSTSTTESLTANMGRVLANGLSDLPVVLLAGTLYRASAGTTAIWHFTGIRHRSVSTTDPSIYVSGGVARFDFTANSGYSFSIYGVCVNHQASGDAPNYTSTEYSVRGAGFFWFGAYASGRSVYIRAICQGNSNNDSSYSNAPLWNSYGDGVTRMQIIAVGYAY